MELTVVSTIGQARRAIAGGADIVVLPMTESKLEVYVRTSRTELVDWLTHLYCVEQYRSTIPNTVCFVYQGRLANLTWELVRAANH